MNRPWTNVPLFFKFLFKNAPHFLGSLATLLLLWGCGTNRTQQWAADDAPAKAQSAMESGRYEEAQNILSAYVGKPQGREDYKAMSLLGAAVAARAGVIMLDLVQDLSTGGTQGRGIMSAFMDALPAPNEENLQYLKQAVLYMNGIPAPNLASDMKFQKGIFESCYAFLILKKYTNALGEMDGQALFAMSAQEADEFLTALTSAGQSLSGGALPIGDGVSSLSQGIQSSPGENSQQKLAGYFSGGSVASVP